MATYEHLAGTSFNDLVVPFISENGLGETDTCTQVLTGYTLGVTKFTFTAVLSALENTYIGPSLSRLIWDMGDGSTMTGVSVTKQYMYPGTYNITTIFTDQNGKTHKNLLTQTIKVYNYIPDSLVWYTEAISDPEGGKPEKCKCGQPSEDLTIYRYNSWQSWPVVSGDGGYFINLYSQGSKSRPLTQEQYWKNPDTHFVPSWRFVKDKESTVPIERLQTDNNEFIYVKNDEGVVVQCDPTDSDSFFAGTSGLTTVNYIDDNSNRLTSERTDEETGGSRATYANTNVEDQAEFDLLNKTDENKDIILFASFDTSKFPATVYDHEMANYENFKKEYFQIYETQKIGLPMQVKFNTPNMLNITSNGMPDFKISDRKYLESPFSVTVRTADADNRVICTDDVVSLSSRWSATAEAFSAQDITTDLITQQGYVSLYLSGSDTTFERITEPFKSDEDFKTWDVGQVKVNSAMNSHVILLLAEYNGESPSEFRPPDGRKVTLLITDLVPEDQNFLRGAEDVDIVWTESGDVKPRHWKTKSGLTYYGYVSPKSKFKNDDSIKMDVQVYDEVFDTPGAVNTFVNLESDWSIADKNNRYRIVAETLIDPPTYFGSDVLYYYLANPSTDTVHQLKPVYYRQYSYGPDGYTQTYVPPISTQSPGNSGMYGFAVDTDGGTYTVDSDTDKVIRFYRNMNTRVEYEIKNLFPQSTRDKHYPDNPDAYGYSPSSISLDGKLDYWITLYDTISTVKVSGETNKIIAVAIPPEFNDLVDVRTTEPSSHWHQDAEYSLNTVEGRPGEYGENLLNPTVVETCRNNDIVVSYTNPLCSFVARFDENGNFKHKFDLPGEDRYITGDMCVDINDHIWVITDSTGLTNDGQVDMSPGKGIIYNLNEELEVITTVDSVKGTGYHDMLLPAPHRPETHEYTFTMDLEYNWQRQEYDEVALILEDNVKYEPNPRITFEEGNTYIIKNKFWNGGEHQFEFKYVTEDDSVRSLDDDAILWSRDAATFTEEDGVTGIGTDTLTIVITKDTPNVFLLIDTNNPGMQCVVNVIKKPVIETRDASTFNIINNPAFVIPDNNNNIWFSWGHRFCSRYHAFNKEVDMTLAIGEPYPTPRYHPLDPKTYDRRDNADRRSVIEALSFDTANNLLALNNNDKRLYCINSDNYALSAFINVDHHQTPYEDFTWVESICSTKIAGEDDFMLYPDSYMTKEQIQVFLRNANQGRNVASIYDADGDGDLDIISERGNNLPTVEDFTGSDDQLNRAYQSYLSVINELDGSQVQFRTNHGANPVSATGFEEEVRAIGDWTGWKWINKYDSREVVSDATTGFISLTGQSNEFSLYPRRGLHEIIKKGETVDFAGVLRSYIKQPVLRESPKLYDDLLDAIFGTSTSDPNTIGKRVYEKIANFTSNIKDVDTCTIDALVGLASMVNYKLLEIAPNLPAELQRLTDLLSINFSRLRGVRTDLQEEFETGLNLGAEILMIYPWRSDHSYARGDYTLYKHPTGTKYYQALETIPRDEALTPPSESQFWIEWPDGYVRDRHRIDIDRTYAGKDDQWREEYYEKQKIRVKLVEKLHVQVGKKFVIKEEHTNQYHLIDPMTIGVEDEKTYHVNFENDRFNVIDPNARSRQSPEFLAALGFIDAIATIEDDILTLIGTPISNNPTITLFRNKVYKLHIDSPGHPVIITKSPGLSGERVRNFVSKQEVEFSSSQGEIIIRTDTHPVDGPIPSMLYYQSMTDPSICGAISVIDIEGIDHYSSTLNGLTAFDITLNNSYHDTIDRYGWGMSFPESANAWQFYTLYEYIPDGNPHQDHINNIIDWTPADDPLVSRGKTTVEFSLSSYDDWVKSNGLIDTIFEKTLREGLDFFDGIESVNKYKSE